MENDIPDNGQRSFTSRQAIYEQILSLEHIRTLEECRNLNPLQALRLANSTHNPMLYAIVHDEIPKGALEPYEKRLRGFAGFYMQGRMKLAAEVERLELSLYCYNLSR